ncbi:MAG: DUF4143 domain-containing protein [Chitinivibrionales bacterium]|nr:DUF4143 domain-containing protein [Chitinivibrionales bacterium]
MVTRILERRLKELATRIPILTVLGPRQAGKTTLARAAFPNYTYVNLESLRYRDYAREDPVGFLGQYSEGVIIDEVQRAPDLLSEIQVMADESRENGRFVLTGSQNILLMETISQSLAGRTIISKLLPFSVEELMAAAWLPRSASQAIYQGFYPRLYDQGLSVLDWMPSYIETYVERDVRTIRNVLDLPRFQKFLTLCAGRIGQILNYASLANDVGVDEKTIKSWIGILETTFVAFRLMPYHRNLGKRVLKSPKLYFYDTGLACHLLGIRSSSEVLTHYLRGSLFENLVIVDLLKSAYAHEGDRQFYFWRDSNGHEVDLITEQGGKIHVLEIKSSETMSAGLLKGLLFFESLAADMLASSSLVYAGTEPQKRGSISILPWNSLNSRIFPWRILAG